MKNDITTAELLANANLSETIETIVDTSGDFSLLVKVLSLDKTSDFRFSNLNGVDFSNADLRGFNFKGADLRNSFGIDVKIDDTTILDNADLRGSCFAALYREMELFRTNPKASQMYNTLQQGSPFEVSSWIHAKYGHGKSQSSILKNADAETASILCQRLMMDDIDLTKRSDLFHYLRNITGNERKLRELILRILATHINNLSVAKKFITIAGQLYSRDPVVAKAIKMLTQAQNEKIREAAFLTLERTKFALEHLIPLQETFLAANNTGIRKRALRRAAINLGRKHLSAINLKALNENVDLEEILDVEQLMDSTTVEQIASRTVAREQEIKNRLGDSKKEKSATAYEIKLIRDRQEEVIFSAPILRLFYAAKNPEQAKEAKDRIRRQAEKQQ